MNWTTLQGFLGKPTAENEEVEINLSFFHFSCLHPVSFYLKNKLLSMKKIFKETINMKHLIFCIVTAILLISCGQKPKIDYENKIDTTSVLDDSIKDTTKIMVSELPVKFDSTDVLMFAVGLVDLQERGGYIKTGSDYSTSDIASSYFNKDHLIGNFINLVFRDKSGDERKLTDKKIKVRNVNFLREIFNKTKTGYILYSISDRDTNGDKELSHADLEALYISKIDGRDFRKISKELHEFYDYNLIKGENKVYFRTLEDINKDGELNNKDKFHYYYIDFALTIMW